MAVQERYGDQVVFVGVPGLSGDQGAMQQFVADTGSDTFPHLVDPGGEVWDSFGVRQQRTYVLANQDGTTKVIGYGGLEQEVRDLVAR